MLKTILPYRYLLCALYLSLPHANAAPLDTMSMSKAAKKACIVGDYAKGADILGDLFVETNNPIYVYNQARCYEQNHRYVEAIDRFREYLRKATNITDGEKADAEQHIADCQKHLPAATATTTNEPPTNPPSTSPGATEPTPPPTTITLVEQPTAPRSGSALRTAGIATSAVGVLVLGAGVYFAQKTKTLSNQLNTPNTPYDQGKEKEISNYTMLGWISYGVGAAALITGTTLYLLGLNDDGGSATVTVTPTMGPAYAGFSCGGRF